MASQYVVYFFMMLMLITGTTNMLFAKFQHMQHVPMAPGGHPEPFYHPVLQAGFMMVGEILCLLVYYCFRTQEEIEQGKQVPKWIFLVPSSCDLIATVLLNVALALLMVSVVQMCRGTVVLFVCAMSVTFLGRRQYAYHYVGVLLVVVGITVVSLSSMVNTKTGTVSAMPSSMVMGIGILVLGQVFQAGMFVYEEKIMCKYPVPPLQCVGMEGVFGLIICIAVLIPCEYLGYAKSMGAFYQMSQSPWLSASVFGAICSLALFNYAGATVTQKASAIARTTIKMSSTILIWMCELSFGWNQFHVLQLVGFVLLAAGTLLYNRIVVIGFLEPSPEALPVNPAKLKEKSDDP